MKLKNKKLKLNPYSYQKRINYENKDIKFIKKILSTTNYEIINTSPNGIVAYFELSEPKEIFVLSNNEHGQENSVLLNSGKYILKIFTKRLAYEEVDIFRILSNNEIVPKLYFIDQFLLISKYEDGIDLRKLYVTKQLTPALRLYIQKEFNKKFNKLKSLDINHGDLKFSNLLLTRTGKLYLIDPLLGFQRKESDKNKWDNISYVFLNNFFRTGILEDLDNDIYKLIS